MSIVSEKRAGRDRRLDVGKPPSGIGERRADDRRQTIISDISFIEWATHFASFQQEWVSKNAEEPGDDHPPAANDGGEQQ